MRVLLVAMCLLSACGSSAAGGDDSSGDDDVAPHADAGPLADAAPPDAPPVNRVVRFVALGDTGEPNADQRAVAEQIRDLCAARGCDFALLLGDNMYDNGVDGVDDPLWQSEFEAPYADVPLDFYAVLGNHDYGGHFIIDLPGIGNEWDKGPYEVDYSSVSSKWKMPATHYTLRKGHVGFIMLDTNSIVWDNTDHGDQRAWWSQAQTELAGTEWQIVVGHHPYRSNGTHGNAGDYDAPELGGFIPPNPLPIQNGDNMKQFFDEVVCGTGQVYLSGHDHSRQWLDEPDALCGTELIVDGAGSKTSSLVDRGNQTFFEDASKAGFLYVVIDGNTFTGQFYDKDGNLEFERSFTHP